MTPPINFQFSNIPKKNMFTIRENMFQLTQLLLFYYIHTEIYMLYLTKAIFKSTEK
jgi:hypothetical protein